MSQHGDDGPDRSEDQTTVSEVAREELEAAGRAGRLLSRSTVKWFGLVAGPLLALLTYLLLPETYATADGTAQLSAAGRSTAAVGVWMAVWWLTEAVDVPVTALLALVLLPLTQATTIAQASAPYAHPLVFLFLGGFLLALSMQRWGLDERIALMTLRLVGDRPRNIVGGFMLATALMSMWVSNTATVAMMLPIALSVAALVRRVRRGASSDDAEGKRFAVALLLGIAYAASIGGLGTIIGTPPNLFVASFIADHFGREIAFVEWMLLAMPLVAVFLPLGWWLLTRVLYPVSGDRLPDASRLTRERFDELGPVKAGEWASFIAFCLAAFLWVFRPLLEGIEVGGRQPLAGLSDTGIAVAAGLVLFVVPVDVRERVFAMDWETARRLPWGILILFGGGLSLAAAVQANGVSEFLGHQASRAGTLPTLLVVASVATVVIFLTELTSNTATTAALVPVLAAVAPGIGVDAYLLIVPVALAASAAFMMPVATPPNAIVFGSGQLSIPQMARAGIWMNLLSIVLVTATAMLLVPVVLGAAP
jgi:solute carrier family 13 (sodium-dependent dicarboxylate transporter), member 2/3/5